MTQLIYSPQQYTPIECEEDPDTSIHQIKVLKNDWSYSHRHRQGYPRVEDACQNRVQVLVDDLVLPVHEVLAKFLRHGRRGNLERICIGSLPVIHTSMHGIRLISQYVLNP
jgi:hypothetical protein